MFYYDLIFTSFQGMIVAYVYCLQNTQVRQECRRRYNQHFAIRNTPSVFFSSNTQDVTISDDKEEKNKSASRFNSIAFEENNIELHTFTANRTTDDNV